MKNLIYKEQQFGATSKQLTLVHAQFSEMFKSNVLTKNNVICQSKIVICWLFVFCSKNMYTLSFIYG